MNPNAAPQPEECLVCIVEVMNRAPKTRTEMAGLQTLVNTIEAALAEWRAVTKAEADAEAAKFIPLPTERGDN